MQCASSLAVRTLRGLYIVQTKDYDLDKSVTLIEDLIRICNPETRIKSQPLN